ncbi:hypothetical protein NC651_006588 [Populus alba x Populus x berolinensis]|nr:hypothetical protein NC651_006588 [Populus alba x Populus x berolinensis]
MPIWDGFRSLEGMEMLWEMEYDGIVLESWSRWAAYGVLHDPEMRNKGGEAIAGIEYLSLLEKHKPKLQWEKNSGEDFFLYIDDDHINHAVFSRRSSTRGAGISIWERVLSEWKRRKIFFIDLEISEHKDWLAADTVFFYKAKRQGNEWQRYPFPMPRQQQLAFTEDRLSILCFTFHPIILKETKSV